MDCSDKVTAREADTAKLKAALKISFDRKETCVKHVQEKISKYSFVEEAVTTSKNRNESLSLCKIIYCEMF